MNTCDYFVENIIPTGNSGGCGPGEQGSDVREQYVCKNPNFRSKVPQHIDITCGGDKSKCNLNPETP